MKFSIISCLQAENTVEKVPPYRLPVLLSVSVSRLNCFLHLIKKRVVSLLIYSVLLLTI